MAITKLQAPVTGQPISRPLLHYVSSNQTTYSDFAYLFDLYYYPIGGVPGIPILIGKFKIVPDTTYSRGLFDASKIIKGYIQTKFEPTENLLAWSTDKVKCTYRVQYGEYYNGTSHYNVIPDIDDVTCYYLWSDILNASTLPLYPTVYQWLTDRDTTNLRVPRNRTFLIPVNNSAFGTIYNTQRISITGDNGTGGYSHNFDNTTALQVLTLNLNSYIINQSFIDDATEDLDALVPDWWATLRVKNNYNYGTIRTSEARVNYTCPKINSVQLHFLNRYGAFETMSFDAVNKQIAAIERKQYKRQGIELGSASVSEFSSSDYTGFGETYVFSTKDTTFYTKQDYSYKLTSDWVNETDYNWLKQLIASPLVYTDVYTPGDITIYYPVQIKTATWEQKLNYSDKMFNLELEINVGQIIL
jgi:hypothetical protein